ncbi:hypothetical protein SRS16CHR_01438 [Variovorax sp. SRS16]|uniref:hypothetical protein n=1 Tax=Variovorax sp. SRS16 TaxID=282217 RepID=UPI001318EF56|nr:hypothetical protein [Variovorax sp. SRS16]VTU15307.1 hypothetical protein SRS16CHR_01438 [Variovorax sp. SRS16]
MNTFRSAFKTVPVCGASMMMLACLVMVGCQSQRPRPMSPNLPPPPEFVAAPGVCMSSRIHFALRQRISLPLLEEMRMRAGAYMARAVLPDDPPLPFRADRLLVDVEPNGRVVAARCG